MRAGADPLRVVVEVARQFADPLAGADFGSTASTIVTREGFDVLAVGCARVVVALPGGRVAKVPYRTRDEYPFGARQATTEWLAWTEGSATVRDLVMPTLAITPARVTVQPFARRLAKSDRAAERSARRAAATLEAAGFANLLPPPKVSALLTGPLGQLAARAWPEQFSRYQGEVLAHDYGALHPDAWNRLRPRAAALERELADGILYAPG